MGCLQPQPESPLDPGRELGVFGRADPRLRRSGSALPVDARCPRSRYLAGGRHGATLEALLVPLVTSAAARVAKALASEDAAGDAGGIVRAMLSRGDETTKTLQAIADVAVKGDDVRRTQWLGPYNSAMDSLEKAGRRLNPTQIGPSCTARDGSLPGRSPGAPDDHVRAYYPALRARALVAERGSRAGGGFREESREGGDASGGHDVPERLGVVVGLDQCRHRRDD